METEWPRVTTTTAVEHPICEANEPWKHIARAERALWFIRAGPKRNRNLPTTPLRLTPSPLSVRNVSGVQCTSNSTSAADFFVVHLLRFLPSLLRSGPPCQRHRFSPQIVWPLVPTCSLPPTSSRTPKIGSHHRQLGRSVDGLPPLN